MSEFSAQDAVRPIWNESLTARALRGLGISGAAFAIGGAVLWILLGYIVRANPVVVFLLAAMPLLTGLLLLAGAVAVRMRGPLAAFVSRFAFLIFLGGVVSTVVIAWLPAIAYGEVDAMVGAQDASARAVRTTFGGELTLSEMRSALGGGLAGIFAYLLWPLQFQIVRDLIALLGVVGFISIVAMFGIWWERKVAGRIQSRLGPMRVGGWHGWAQSLADGIKCIQKEDLCQEGADRPLFRLAPYIAFVPALSAFMALPFSAAWVFRDLDVGLIFILAMLGIGVVGVLLAGWASNNKWSVYGAMREACQMVSYEIPMGMSLLIPVMTAGTLRLTEIGRLQEGGFHTWLAFENPFTFIAAVMYFTASLAACKRAPFDLPEAESELVSGYHTEYSGYRWSLFFFAEYAEMFAVGALATILFFGAWNSPLPASWGAELAQGALWQKALHGLLFNGPIWFVCKSFFCFYVQIWIRWTLPRIRLDQVMYACVQVMLPMTMVVLLGNTLWELFILDGTVIALLTNLVLTAIGAVLVLGFITIAVYGFVNRRRLVGTLAVDHLPGA